MEAAPPVRVLLVEDGPAPIGDALRAHGHPIVSGGPSPEAIDGADFEVAVVDLALPGDGGLDAVRRVAGRRPAAEALVVAGPDGLETAIEAMRLGAYDYVTRPARMDELELLVRKAGEKARLRRENDSLRALAEGKGPPPAAGVRVGSLAEVERDHIQSVLRMNGGHRGRTARALGIDPKTLYNKLGPERPRKKA